MCENTSKFFREASSTDLTAATTTTTPTINPVRRPPSPSPSPIPTRKRPATMTPSSIFRTLTGHDQLQPTQEPAPSPKTITTTHTVFEIEELHDEEEEGAAKSDDDDEEYLAVAQPIVKKFFFVESQEELRYVSGSSERRPNETYLVRDYWFRSDITDFLGIERGMGFTQDEIDKIVELSMNAQRVKRKIYAEYKTYKKGLVNLNEFKYANIFDFRALQDILTELFEVEKRPRQHLIMFLVPGSKPRYIAGDIPSYLSIPLKKDALLKRFMAPCCQPKRVLYWAQPTSNIREPSPSFGSKQPMEIYTYQPVIERCDQIITAFMYRDWKLEEIFTIPEFA